VGTGGAPAFESYSAHGNTSSPNNYMRRVDDDAPVLPLFPHGYLPDGEVRLFEAITPESTLQWHITSIQTTVSLSWAYPLFVQDPVFNRWMFARFVAYLPVVDLSSRASNLFDSAYAYRKCAAPGSTSTVQMEEVTGYTECTALEEGESMSDDDFFLDLNLMLGIPAAIPDSNPHWGPAGGWQAWELPEFSSVDPNCTGSYGDQNLAGFLWTWGFWAGSIPIVSHKQIGYDPNAPGTPSKFLAEFGVNRAGGTLPAFAFSFLPKMIPLIAPSGLGGSFPMFLMGKLMDLRQEIGDAYGVDPPTSSSTLMFLVGPGTAYYLNYYSHGMFTLYTWAGSYLLVWSAVTLIYGVIRMKVDAKL